MNMSTVVEGYLDRRAREAKRRAYRDDPVLWARDVVGVHLWSKQADAARAVAEKQNVVVKAGHGVGKSFLAGILVCWWVDTRYPDCFVASTAPSTAQIKAIVWREVANIAAIVEKRYNEGLVDHKLPGYRTSDAEWKTDDGTLIGFGRKPPEGENRTGDSLQGIHAAGGVLAIGDEAVGLSEQLIDALGNITSTSNSRRFLICNPTNPASYVAKLFRNKPANWDYHTISVLDSPNFTDEKDETPPEVLKALTDQSYLDAKREEYGVGSAMWKSRVEGEFAWDMGHTLFRPEDLAKSMDTEIVPSTETLPVLGVDVSRSKSGDMNTVYKYHDGKLRFLDEWNSPNAIETAERIDRLARSQGASEVRIDGAGLGGPIADFVRDISGGKYEVVEILGGNPSPDRNRWFNFRAWSWSDLQTRMSRGEIDIDPADEDLQEQLMSVEIKPRLSGVNSLLLESKEELRKRGVHSPDHADAAVYAAVDLSPWQERLPEGSGLVMDRAGIPDFGIQEWLSAPGRPFV